MSLKPSPSAPSRFATLALALLLAALPLAAQSTSAADGATSTTSAKTRKTTHKTSGKTGSKASNKTTAARHPGAPSRATHTARTAQTTRTATRIHEAFTASTELRPMAQQLANTRTPEAYAGVVNYAQSHSGDAAAAAYLALGHAYLLDKRYAEAAINLRKAHQDGEALADFADFLGAQASHGAGEESAAESLLHGFTSRYPGSIFNSQVPELEATVLLAMNNPAAARQALAVSTTGAGRAGYQLAQAQVDAALGQQDAAIRAFKQLLLSHPLTPEAETARAQLTQLGAETALTAAELRSLADAYMNAGRYGEAAEQYRALLRSSAISAQDRNSFAVSEAACELKLKRLTTAQAQALPNTDDENGAHRLDLLMEMARNREDTTEQQRLVTEMESRFPHSRWLAEALFSSGNMYMLSHDYPTAVQYYSDLSARFPASTNAAAAHWRAGWLSYREGKLGSAAIFFSEQIHLYPSAQETVSALYWRGRLYEVMDHAPAQAAANYRTILRVWPHYFYAQMARVRLAALGGTVPAQVPELDSFQPVPQPTLVETFPDNSPHLAVARLLANAGLNEYIAPEIASDPDSSSWSALAEAQIYASFDEHFRALRLMKKALPSASSAPIESIPLAYWRILFPEPYWDTIKAESARNNLDPYFVASLIRQESEFNPTVVSRANAYGLMQLLPSVGKSMAKELGMSNFQTFQLLDPATNIRLGTRYLRQMLDHFGGVQEYALAAYNAGDNRVVDWQAHGPYSGIDEFVESIPFTETRDYVQAIDRNVEIYRAIDDYARRKSTVASYRTR